MAGLTSSRWQTSSAESRYQSAPSAGSVSTVATAVVSTTGARHRGPAPAVRGEGVDHEHGQAHAEDRPERLEVDPRQEGDRGDARRDDADPTGPLGAGHDGEARRDEDDPDGEPHPTPRGQIALEEDGLYLV